MQLEFRCPECRVSGLTPEIRDDKAIAVALKQLRIRCPACSAIVEVTEPLGRVLWKTQERLTGALVETAERSLSSLVREALRAEIARRAAKKNKEQNEGQQDGPANGSQPIRSETNSTSSAAGSRR
jgi:phage FluMu protein Com